MVLNQGLLLAVLGIALGAAGALGLSRLVKSLLYGVGPTDALTYVVVGTVLTAVAVVASYIPARRAASIDPIEALRAE